MGTIQIFMFVLVHRLHCHSTCIYKYLIENSLHLPFHAPIRVLQYTKQNLVMTPIPLKLIDNQNDILPELITYAHYSDIDVVSTLEEMKIVQEFISRLQDASLDQGGLEEEVRERLKNPITVPIDLETDPSLRAGMNLFLDTTNASYETYSYVEKSINSYLDKLSYTGVNLDPDEHHLPSLYSVKKAVGEVTGLHSIMTDMCPNTCIAYSGPYADLDQCPSYNCRKPRYDVAMALHCVC
ncbi:hypothetical protein BDN70DRAFT_224059 [Pholiota conissans]|uniref:Uncharacterized protein n=1 Tax=Pholiota conissans TaxID=109636 RepID=A0A9P6CXK4_9AGAR|nr:hypothetical protein BDN70DRAFT_224059 [Pholiota conissans]